MLGHRVILLLLIEDYLTQNYTVKLNMLKVETNVATFFNR